MALLVNGAAMVEMHLASRGIPLIGVSPLGGAWVVTYAPEATAAQIAEGDTIAATYGTGKYRQRSLDEIFVDVNALSGPQKVATWNDLMSGAPHKYFTSTGPNAASIVVMDWAVNTTTLAAADKQAGQLRVMTFYVQDNPFYLVNPPFAPEVNVPGLVLI